MHKHIFPINTAKAKARLEAKIAEINRKQPVKTFWRNGKLVSQRTKAISTGAKDTALLLIGYYAVRFDQARKAYMTTMVRMPALHTNNPFLSRERQIHPNSVQNHLSALAKAGIIVKKFRGTDKDFALWISPEILFSADEMPEFLNASESTTYPPKAQNLGHTPSQERSSETVTISGICGKQEKKEREGRGEQNNPTIMANQNAVQAQEGKITPWGGGGLPENSPLRKLEEWQLAYLVGFWSHAWKQVYNSRQYSDSQHHLTLLTILRSVFHYFNQPQYTQEDWADVYDELIQRIDKAAKYYQRYPTAYKPDPYSVQKAGKGYFDYENERGFRGTEKWLESDLMMSYNRKLNQSFKTCWSDFNRLLLKKTTRKAVQNKDFAGLYDFWKAHFRGHGQKALERFEQHYAAKVKPRLPKPKPSAPTPQQTFATSRLTIEEYKSMLLLHNFAPQNAPQ